ncbi:MAG: hypothetical protein ACP5KE_04925 [Candidatus Methanodesulfokora sp.]|jgi:hypothetical protein
MGEAYGEIIFEGYEPFVELLKKLRVKEVEQIERELREKGKCDASLSNVKIHSEMRNGLLHVKFDGDELWMASAAPSDENYVDWLKRISAGVLWISEVFKAVDVHKKEGISFLFFSEDEIERKKEEMNEQWMKSLEDISGFFNV